MADTIGSRLRDALSGRHVEDVARRAGTTPRHIYRMLADETKTSPRVDTVAGIASATGVRASWLAGWDDERE